jgi:hypothetical protein
VFKTVVYAISYFHRRKGVVDHFNGMSSDCLFLKICLFKRSLEIRDVPDVEVRILVFSVFKTAPNDLANSLNLETIKKNWTSSWCKRIAVINIS